MAMQRIAFSTNVQACLLAAQLAVAIVVAVLKLLPSYTDTHGLEGMGKYLQQV